MLTKTIVSPVITVTHASYSEHCGNLARASKLLQGTHVQVQVKGATICGQVCDLARFKHSQADWFKVRTPLALGWFPSSRVRLCSGLPDNLCTCETVATVIHSGETL